MASFITRLLSSCLILLCITGIPCLGFSSNPPLGNSIALSATTLDGKITYSCHHGMWLPVSIAATLVKSTGNGQEPIGSYLRTFLNTSQTGTRSYDNDDNAGTWSLINTEGDAAESGHSSSLVTGKVISSLSISNDMSAAYMRDFLSQARLHRFDGEASRISYIMQKNAVSNELPLARCAEDESNYTLSVTYKAEYIFWKQDMVPPPVIPSQIAVDSSREQPLEAFFAMGTAAYTAGRSGSAWAFEGAEGRLYDVPGGEQLGSFHLNGSLGVCLWTESAAASQNYATTTTCGTPLASIVVDSLSLPWSHVRITESTGNVISLGSLSSIQMVSTYGGVAPSTSPNTLDGENQSSTFTSIFWIYTHQT